MTSTGATITSSPHICWGVVDDNLLLFNPADRRLHVLNNTAAMVWAFADGTTTLDDLVDKLAAEYATDRATIEPDVVEVAGRLIEAGLCNHVGAADSWRQPTAASHRGPDLPSFEERFEVGPFNALGSAVGVIVKDKDLRVELERILAPLVDENFDPATANGRMLYEVYDDDLGFNLRVNGEYLARGTTRPLALRALLSDVNARAISYVDDALVLHAAAVEIREAIVVMPGASHSGKSTLVTRLCERGAKYLTDEAVAIGHDGIIARPFPKSICLERGVQSALPQFAPDDSSIARGATWDLDPRTIGPGVLSNGGPVSALVFPIYRPHTPTPIFRKIERVETMHRLIANSFDFSVAGQRGFAVLIRLANRLPAYELAHGGQNHLGLVEDLARSLGGTAAAA